MKFLRDMEVAHKRVLVRTGFNVPVGDDGRVDEQEDWRLRASLPTLNLLKKRKAKIILISHLGRPKGKVVRNLRLDPIAQRLKQLLSQDIDKLDDCVGKKVKEKIDELEPGKIILLENLRFHPEEESNELGFAQELAELGEVYINDAFSVSHRAHASLVGIPRYLPSAAGLLLEKEIKTLKRVLDKPKHPLVVIIGGAKIATKIKMIKNFLKKADDLLLGGALANTLICAKGICIGRSIADKTMMEEVKKLELTDISLHLPLDAVVAAEPSGKAQSRVAAIGKTGKQEMILDIGPDTIQLFSNVIARAKTIIWNGPMGLAEIEKFCSGTKGVGKAVAQSKAFSVVGGGDTITVLSRMNLLDKISHISTGGGAMLKFLSGEKLPGIEALET